MTTAGAVAANGNSACGVVLLYRVNHLALWIPIKIPGSTNVTVSFQSVQVVQIWFRPCHLASSLNSENVLVTHDNIRDLPGCNRHPCWIASGRVVIKAYDLEVLPYTTPSAFGIDRKAAVECIFIPSVNRSECIESFQKFRVEPGSPCLLSVHCSLMPQYKGLSCPGTHTTG